MIQWVYSASSKHTIQCIPSSHVHTRPSYNSQYLVKCESTPPPSVRHNILFSTNVEVCDGEYLYQRERANYYQDILIFTSAKHFQTSVVTQVIFNEKRTEVVMKGMNKGLLVWAVRRVSGWNTPWLSHQSITGPWSVFTLPSVKTKQRREVAVVQLMLILAGHLKKLRAPSKNIYLWSSYTC